VKNDQSGESLNISVNYTSTSSNSAKRQFHILLFYPTNSNSLDYKTFLIHSMLDIIPSLVSSTSTISSACKALRDIYLIFLVSSPTTNTKRCRLPLVVWNVSDSHSNCSFKSYYSSYKSLITPI